MSAPITLWVSTLFSGVSVLRTINVRLETATLLGDFSDFGQREHLESAAVRQDRSVPALELVEPAGCLESASPRPQIEMIGVARMISAFNILLQVAVIVLPSTEPTVPTGMNIGVLTSP